MAQRCLLHRVARSIVPPKQGFPVLGLPDWQEFIWVLEAGFLFSWGNTLSPEALSLGVEIQRMYILI